MNVTTHHDPVLPCWRDIPRAQLIGATDAVVRVDTATPCGTDLHLLPGIAPTATDARIVGHQSVGTVVEVGSAEATVYVGDRLLVSCSSSRGHHRSLLHRCTRVAEADGQSSHATAIDSRLDPPSGRQRPTDRGLPAAARARERRCGSGFPIMSRIVVGVDPSPVGTAALEWALREAVSTRTSLHAIRAWTPNAHAMEASAYAGGDLEPFESAQAQHEADEQLKLATERVTGSDTIDCIATAVLGAASHVLVEQAERSAMVVVGSRSHGALSRAVLGSVSSAVLHHARKPVTIVPEPREGDGAAPRVIVGVDHSPAAFTALTAAVDQARRLGATLVPVFVHEPLEAPRGRGYAAGLARLEDSERRRLDDAARDAGAAVVQSEVFVGHPAGQLLTAARPQDLLVVGSRGRGGFAGLLLGSTSTQLAQHAPCPVLVVRA